ncbi:MULTISPECIES: DNA cytosine methyltransferase [unclassified Undibacterium]|uniref:DNA cytosine methyltransferase n=2 Tax=unclassified Undibacterium TaxID=2630295 RepID=UPI002AC9D625|nr:MULTISPECIES: DNA cytosine methyltransferase [unclassified Undibacterium]MEB0139140.1 DNA cytosine methyltransferase [Undibacterium sp. CCC2.1]WPX43135.1 DNA cytosine methyltransferase [Undibacterium sp. CCC3.4]
MDRQASAAAFPRRAMKNGKSVLPGYLEFFAGSGLVAYALKQNFTAIWANDISEKKAAVYHANHGKQHFHLGSIADIKGASLPAAPLSWASFPCQDLSLAGLIAGIDGKRSGLVWEWLRVMDEMTEMPEILVAENVTGLMSVDGGSQYRMLHAALRKRGYVVGAIQLDAVHWVPHSRPRVFVIAVKEALVIPAQLLTDGPTWLHPKAFVTAAKDLDGWLWWKLAAPEPRKIHLNDIIEWTAQCDDEEKSARNIALIPDKHRKMLDHASVVAAPGYKRTRASKQVLELRFDGVAGCLRTPKGGSSRQFLVIKKNKKLLTRLLTVRETARLMGAPESFQLPGSYNDGYMAMGDAVAAPCARFLAEFLLSPLLKVIA